MEIGKASKTALRVAIRRAAHQLIDRPPVLADPIAVRLAYDGSPRDMERAQHRVARDFRAYLAARSRYVEERLAVVVAGGVGQYVVLGAGLETFAYRNPFPALRVFEVDLPATQAWKRHLLAEAGIDLPANLTFVPLDLERQTLVDGLVEAGFDRRRPAFFGWLGVVPYLTLEAFRATLDAIAQLPAGSAVSLDYVSSPKTLSPQRSKVFDGLSKRVAAAGEPFRLFLPPEELVQELHRAGFQRLEMVDSDWLNERYFKDRADGLKLSGAGLSRLATAWV
jgi:methyltransferase (TIGR00027 family)